MTGIIKCPNCGNVDLEDLGQVECDDDESLEIFCDEWRCKICNHIFIGAMVSDAFDEDDEF